MLLSLLKDSKKSQEDAQGQLLQLTSALTAAQLEKSAVLQEANAIKAEFKTELMLTKAEVLRLQESLQLKDEEVDRLASSVAEVGTLHDKVRESQEKEALLVAKMEQLQQAKEVQEKLDGANKALQVAGGQRAPKQLDIFKVLVLYEIARKHRPIRHCWQMWWRMAFTERAIRVITENISAEAEAYLEEVLQMHGIKVSNTTAPPPMPTPSPSQPPAPDPTPDTNQGTGGLMNAF